MQKKMHLFIIILGSVILIVGMLIAMKSMKPIQFNVIAGLIILIGTFFAIFGKHEQDQNSSKNTETLLKKTDGLKNQVTNLQDDLSKKDEKIIDLSQQNIELGEMNAKLSIRLSEKAMDIYDLNRKTKYPLPTSVQVHLEFYLKLDDETQQRADAVLSKLNLSSDEKVYSLIDYNLLRSILTFGMFRIDFAQEVIETDKSFTLEGQLLILESHISEVTRLNYNSALKHFFVTVDQLQLKKNNWSFDSNLNHNLIPNSVVDLEKCTVVAYLNPYHSQIDSIRFLEISSPELSLTFQNLKPSNNGIIVCSRKLKL